MTGATTGDQSLFVGRAAGNVPCKVNIKDGKVWNFWYGDRGERSSESGELLLLIDDPAYSPSAAAMIGKIFGDVLTGFTK